MRMTIVEKKILFVYGCENYSATVKRMALAASITVNSAMKSKVCKLHNRLSEEITESEYKILYPMVCSQMRLYKDAEYIRGMVEDETVDMFHNVRKR